MGNAYFQPLLVRPDESVVALTPVDIASRAASGYDEAWLQRLLYHHPEALPVSEIDPSFAGLIPLCMEMDTPNGPVDAVYMTPTGRLALLEAKLWRNPEARRKVVAQILDYATQVARWDYSRLDSAVRQARRKLYPDESFPGLAAWVAEQQHGVSEHRFIDAVSKSLARGDFLLLVAGDGIREGAGAIARYLDRNGAMHFTFGLVECAIYIAPEGARFVQPRVLAQSTNITRTFVQLAEDRLVEQEIATNDPSLGAGEASPELEQYRAKYRAYWAGFLDRLRLEEGQPISAPATSTNQYFVMPEGSGGWISAYLSQSKGQAGVYVTFPRGGAGDRLIALLEGKKEEIDAALGVRVEWVSTPDGRRRGVVKKNFPGDLLVDSRQATQEWLADMTQRFVSVFRPRIEAMLKDSP
jgi:hypothetical protein